MDYKFISDTKETWNQGHVDFSNTLNDEKVIASTLFSLNWLQIHMWYQRKQEIKDMCISNVHLWYNIPKLIETFSFLNMKTFNVYIYGFIFYKKFNFGGKTKTLSSHAP